MSDQLEKSEHLEKTVYLEHLVQRVMLVRLVLMELPERTDNPENPVMFPDQLDRQDLPVWLGSLVNLVLSDQKDLLDQWEQ